MIEEIIDILVLIEKNTKFLKLPGTLENGSAVDITISPIGSVELFSLIQEETIILILEKLYELYSQENAIIRLSTNPNLPNSKSFVAFYNENKDYFQIPFSAFKLLFFGLKELGYIDGMGNHTALQSTDLKITGLGISYLKDFYAEKDKETLNNEKGE